MPAPAPPPSAGAAAYRRRPAPPDARPPTPQPKSTTSLAYKAAPPKASVQKSKAKAPTRNADGDWCFADEPGFRPNLAPYEVLQMGSFGGTYFRPIESHVTQSKFKSSEVLTEYPKEWWAPMGKANMKRMLATTAYDQTVNTYGVKCGGDLYMWESSGWINAIDPYGAFQWYCRFFLGRRCSDDARQISRFNKCMGPTGRWRSTLCGKINNANTAFDSRNVSPVIRQTLQHWGYRLTEKHYVAHCKKKGLTPQLVGRGAVSSSSSYEEDSD